MAAVTLRRATADDAGAAAAVYLASRRHAEPLVPRTRHTEAEVRAWLASSVLVEHEAWVAERSGDVIALMVLRGDSIDQLYVRPEHQRQGVGGRLLDVAKQRRGRLRLSTFEANRPAREFCAKHGFRPLAFGDGTASEEGAPDILYEWRRRVG